MGEVLRDRSGSAAWVAAGVRHATAVGADVVSTRAGGFIDDDAVRRRRRPADPAAPGVEVKSATGGAEGDQVTRTSRRVGAITSAVVLLLTVLVMAPSTSSAGEPPLNWFSLRDLAISPSSSGAVVRVPDGPDNWWLNDVLTMWSNGSAHVMVRLSDPADSLSVVARAEVCDGAPTMQVAVDGVVELTQAVTTSTTGTYAVPGPWAAGVHTVSIRYVDDHRGADCDRNLKLLHVGFEWGTPYAQYTMRGDALQVPATDGAHYRSGPYGLPTLVQWNTSTAVADIALQGATGMDIQVSSQSCDGPAVLELRLDGTRIFRGAVADGGDSWWDPTLTVDLPAPVGRGLHHLEVTFTNDHRSPTCDRNLRFLGVRFWGSV